MVGEPETTTPEGVSLKRTAIALVLSLLVTPSMAVAATPQQKVSAAAEVLHNLLLGSARPPEALINSTSCIIVVPRLIKGAFWLGGRRGKGVNDCRYDEGGWNKPT